MTTQTTEKKMGWEVARELEAKTTTWERIKPDKGAIVAALWGVFAFFVIFLVGCWLAGNPFEATQRIASPYSKAHGLVGTSDWNIVWSVVILAIVFEFLDASAGMGYGTAITPLLLVMGFNPKQIVPIVMIQQATAGMVGTFLHKEFANVEWKLKPMSETIKLTLFITVAGWGAVIISITSVYAIFKVAKVWISLYVAVLLIMMGLVSLLRSTKQRPYRPKMMIFWGALAAFNKGVGGGGYGPVVTIGGLMSGVPVKTMMAITALSEGSTCVVSIITWLTMLAAGEVIDFLLLPSMMLGSMVAAVAAPWCTRAFPEKMWNWVVPAYSLILAAYVTYKVIPDVVAKLSAL